RQPTFVLSIPTDVLYPPAEQRALAAALPHARLVTLDARHGHDAFLIEAARVEAMLRAFRAEVEGRGDRRVLVALAAPGLAPIAMDAVGARPHASEAVVDVVVAGATGRVGSELLRQLAAQSAAIAAETHVALRL